MTLHKHILAVSAALGLSISVATAAPFSIRISGATGADGSADFTIVGDTTLLTANLIYSETEETDSGPEFYSTSFTDAASNLQFGPLTIGSTQAGDTTYTRQFTLSNTGFTYIKETTRVSEGLDPIDENVTGYSLSFHLTETVYTTGRPADIGVDNLGLVLNAQTPFATLPYISVSPGLLTPVPLPSTLPLFGTALVMAAGVTGAARHLRRRAKATA